MVVKEEIFFLVKERKILLSYKHARWKRSKRQQMESSSFHRRMKDGMGSRCSEEQVRRRWFSSKQKVCMSSFQGEACMYCERKRSGRKEKESHPVLHVRFSPRRNWWNTVRREQWWQLEGSAGVALGIWVKRRAEEVEELKEESNEFVNISKNR